jgi:iron complex transport system ATP-binding protein
MAGEARLVAEDVHLAYDGRRVVHGISLDVAPGQFTAVIGPNGCGKSTLLRALVRLLHPEQGSVRLDGTELRRMATKQVARQVGLLPQSPIAPDGIAVRDLVARGRFPHQGMLRRWSAEDEQAVAEALTRTRTLDLAERPVDELSGGQRQRVWIAMVLAQQTPILLLDEPTTFLDPAHQVEVLDLLAELRAHGRTIVTVLHDLNQAGRYADRIVAVRAGRLAAAGTPAEVLTAERLHAIFDLPCRILEDPETGTPLIIPNASAHRGPVHQENAHDQVQQEHQAVGVDPLGGAGARLDGMRG